MKNEFEIGDNLLFGNSRKEQLKTFENPLDMSRKKKYWATGIEKIDSALNGGFCMGLHCIGAISSLGKSTFCIQLMDSLSKNGTPVLYFSLEMNANDINAKSVSRIMYEKDKKLAASSSEILKPDDIYTWEEDKKNLMIEANRELEESSNLSYVIDCSDKPLSVFDIDNVISAFEQKTKEKPFVFVDYLQILQKYSDKYNDKQNMDANITELLRISKRHCIPLVLISALSRAAYNQPVELASFKESGIIEYTAESVLGMQFHNVGTPSFKFNDAVAKETRDIELVVLKNRSGDTGTTISMKYTTKFNIFTFPKKAPKKEKTF